LLQTDKPEAQTNEIARDAYYFDISQVLYEKKEDQERAIKRYISLLRAKNLPW
jgi:hypothetical protein